MKSKHAGFSLIELVSVLALMGTVAGLSFGLLAGWGSPARVAEAREQCATQMREAAALARAQCQPLAVLFADAEPAAGAAVEISGWMMASGPEPRDLRPCVRWRVDGFRLGDTAHVSPLQFKSLDAEERELLAAVSQIPEPFASVCLIDATGQPRSSGRVVLVSSETAGVFACVFDPAKGFGCQPTERAPR